MYLTLHRDVEVLLKQETSGKCSEMQNCAKMIHLEVLSAWFVDLDLDEMALFLPVSVPAWLLMQYLYMVALLVLSAWFLKLWFGVEGSPASPGCGQSAASLVRE